MASTYLLRVLHFRMFCMEINKNNDIYKNIISFNQPMLRLPFFIGKIYSQTHDVRQCFNVKIIVTFQIQHGREVLFSLNDDKLRRTDRQLLNY